MYPFVVEPLPYAYNDLEPIISEETMYYHHDKHYVTYVNKLNELLKNIPEFHNMELEDIIYSTADKVEYKPIYNNAGGVYNHMKFFESMKPVQEVTTGPIDDNFDAIREAHNRIRGELSQSIIRDFTTVGNMMNQMISMAIGLFGSGYVWLCCNKKGELRLMKYANQDTPFIDGLYPLLPIDVWEHAYYLDYRNVRKDYVDNWMGIINWEKVNDRYSQVLANMTD